MAPRTARNRGPPALDHARQRLAAFEQDGAEDGAFGVQVVWRDPRRQLQGAHRHASPQATNMWLDGGRAASIRSRKICTEHRRGEEPVDRRWISSEDAVNEKPVPANC